MELYKGRTLEKGQLVEVYRNLHTKGFSVRDVKTKLVVAHADNVILKNVSFVVSEKGRQKVVESKRKGVHAFLRGEFLGYDWNIQPHHKAEPVYYNPYVVETFVKKTSAEPIFEAEGKVLAEGKEVYLLH